MKRFLIRLAKPFVETVLDLFKVWALSQMEVAKNNIIEQIPAPYRDLPPDEAFNEGIRWGMQQLIGEIDDWKRNLYRKLEG